MTEERGRKKTKKARTLTFTLWVVGAMKVNSRTVGEEGEEAAEDNAADDADGATAAIF